MEESSKEKVPMTAAERKRRQREKAREKGLQGVELEISHDLKAKLEWSAKKNEMTLKAYIAHFLEDGHQHIK